MSSPYSNVKRTTKTYRSNDLEEVRLHLIVGVPLPEERVSEGFVGLHWDLLKVFALEIATQLCQLSEI